MKRIFALIISLMLVTCIFAACGDDDTYRQPGTGTTLGGNVTTPAIDDQNGSYSADTNGEVNQTTDNDGILEDGMNDLENGIEQGMDDIEQGLDDLGDGAEDMLGGNNADGMDANGAVLDENAPEAMTPDEVDYDGIAGPSQPSGLDPEGDNANAAGNNNTNNNNNNAGNTNGATNGNSH